jgi:hypothetical protein
LSRMPTSPTPRAASPGTIWAQWSRSVLPWCP